jgi:uncharacterized iron-regulated membrane protein
MRKLLLTLHLWTTLVAGAFIVILGVTGCVIAFETDLDRLFHASLFDVPPQPIASLPLTTLQDIVQRRFEGSRVQAFGLPQRRDAAYVANLDSGSEVFVNGYTGAILGSRRGPTLLSRIHQLHIRLLAGKPGEKIMTIAGILMLFLALSGGILWWKYTRFTIKWNGSLFRMMFDLHNAGGISTLVFLLLLSATGVVIALENPIVPWMYKVTGTTRIPRTLPSTPGRGSVPIAPDQALRIARTTEPGAAPLMIELPVARNGSYTVRMHFPEDRTPGGRSWVCVDQYSGKVLVTQSSRTAPLPMRAYLMNRQIHTGDIFGVPSRIAMSASSLFVTLQAISGLVMWRKRERKRQPKNG